MEVVEQGNLVDKEADLVDIEEEEGLHNIEVQGEVVGIPVEGIHMVAEAQEDMDYIQVFLVELELQ
jgi:hypothetical protein